MCIVKWCVDFIQTQGWKMWGLAANIKIHFEQGCPEAWICWWGFQVIYLVQCSVKLKWVTETL